MFLSTENFNSELNYLSENIHLYINTEYHQYPENTYIDAVNKGMTDSFTHVYAIKIANQYGNIGFAEYAYDNSIKLNQHTYLVERAMQEFEKSNSQAKNNKNFIIWQHNPYSINNPTIEFNAPISLSERNSLRKTQQKINTLMQTQSTQRDKILSAEIQMIKKIISEYQRNFHRILFSENQTTVLIEENEQRIEISKKFTNSFEEITEQKKSALIEVNKKLEKKAKEIQQKFTNLVKNETTQRQNLINTASSSRKEILSDATKSINAIEQKEETRLATINKNFQAKFKSLLEQENKSRSNIIQEKNHTVQQEVNIIFLNRLKNLLSISINTLDAFAKQTKKEHHLPELDIYIKYLCNPFKELKQKHLKYKNFSNLTFKDIQLLQEISWKISKFGGKIYKITNAKNIPFPDSTNFANISSSIKILLDQIFDYNNINSRTANSIRVNLSALSLLEQLNEINSETSKNSTTNNKLVDFILLDFIKKEISSLDIKKFAKEIDHFNKHILKCIEDMQKTIRNMTKDYPNVTGVTCEEFWVQYMQYSIDIIYLYNPNLKKFVIELLFQSCSEGNLLAFKAYLESAIEYKLDLTVRDHGGRTALHFACVSGNTEIIKKLLEINPGLINMEDKVGITPAWICSELGNAEVAHILLKNSADFKKIRKEKNMSPATNAMQKGHIHILMMIMNPDQVTPDCIQEFYVAGIPMTATSLKT